MTTSTLVTVVSMISASYLIVLGAMARLGWKLRAWEKRIDQQIDRT